MVHGKSGLKMVQKKKNTTGQVVSWMVNMWSGMSLVKKKSKGNIPTASRRELGLNTMSQEKKSL